MKITITGSGKDIAALVLKLQERQKCIVNQLVLDAVNNASFMQNSVVRNTGSASNDSVDIENSGANN